MAKIKDWWYQVLASMWSTKNSQMLLTGVQSVITTLKNSLTVYYKGKHTPTLWSLLGIYPREIKTYIHTKICMLFIAAFFLTHKIPNVHEWGNGQLNVVVIISNKRSNCWCMQQERWTLKALYKVKEASPKSYQRHDSVSQKGSLQGQKAYRWCQALRVGNGLDNKGA